MTSWGCILFEQKMMGGTVDEEGLRWYACSK
jgi:hypothetical protein